ncbi:MAG TPA: hypothetical protein VGN37_27695 [Actinocatenispora sp.]
MRTRWSLLAVLLALGVALMHTLGHPATGHDGRAHVPAAHGAVDGLFAASYPDLPADAADMPMPGRHGMDPTLVCLAVLTALLVLAVTVALSVRRFAALRPPVPARALGRRSRAPPGVGRTLATVSVLRI